MPNESTSRTQGAHKQSNEKPSKRILTVQEWMSFGAIIVALVALVVALTGGMNTDSKNGHFNDDQVSKAEESVCKHVANIRRVLEVNTHQPVPEGNIYGTLAVLANIRLALYGGGSYLQHVLTEYPATPADLTDAVNEMSNTLQQMGIGYLAEVSEDIQKQLRDTLTRELSKVGQLCS